MQLPSNEVGISDILAHRECPQRFAFGMRRHVPLPERFQIEPGERDEPPESTTYANAYGSCVHDAIQVVEDTQCSDQQAIDAVWPKWHHWMEPDDQARMERDLQTYRSRSETGYRVLGTELELRIPLFQHDGEWIYFRGRIDVLYQHIQNPGVFLSRDYKSSRWPRSEEEVHKDLQQWSYNLLVHENYPECEHFIQVYDQLRYGAIPTRKSDLQRRQIKAWLIRQVKTILADDTLKPKINQWCQTCPLMPDCRVTHQATDFWINRLSAVAPEKKEGRKLVVQLTEEIGGMEFYVELLPKAKQAVGQLGRFVEAVEGVLKEMPQDRREEFGYRLGKPSRRDTFTADALSRIHQRVGGDFYHLIGITKKAVNDFYGEDGEEAKEIMALSTPKDSSPPLKAIS
jgi:hypothetical protein